MRGSPPRFRGVSRNALATDGCPAHAPPAGRRAVRDGHSTRFGSRHTGGPCRRSRKNRIRGTGSPLPIRRRHEPDGALPLPRRGAADSGRRGPETPRSPRCGDRRRNSPRKHSARKMRSSRSMDGLGGRPAVLGLVVTLRNARSRSSASCPPRSGCRGRERRPGPGRPRAPDPDHDAPRIRTTNGPPNTATLCGLEFRPSAHGRSAHGRGDTP